VQLRRGGSTHLAKRGHAAETKATDGGAEHRQVLGRRRVDQLAHLRAHHRQHGKARLVARRALRRSRGVRVDHFWVHVAL